MPIRDAATAAPLPLTTPGARAAAIWSLAALDELVTDFPRWRARIGILLAQAPASRGRTKWPWPPLSGVQRKDAVRIAGAEDEAEGGD
jgi:hypothetical protein